MSKVGDQEDIGTAQDGRNEKYKIQDEIYAASKENLGIQREG
jgi:hypothetical protein